MHNNPLKIILCNLGKRYNSNWIFKNINYEFSADNSYVILGANGSGKSTLLQLLAGSLTPSTGEIKYHTNSGLLSEETIYSNVSIVAPYLDLIEAYTLEETIAFHFQFKQFYPGINSEKFLAILNLNTSKDKFLKEFSSGMKQRVKLALAILSNTPLLLLDEPLSNLDQNGIEWYSNLMNSYRDNRLVIVCSNQQKEEYNFCTKELLVEEFK